MDESSLDLIVAGTGEAVLMVESEARELSEDLMLGAVMFGHSGFQPVIDAIIQLAELAAKPPREHNVADNSELHAKVRDLSATGLGDAYKIVDKGQRRDAISAV